MDWAVGRSRPQQFHHRITDPELADDHRRRRYLPGNGHSEYVHPEPRLGVQVMGDSRQMVEPFQRIARGDCSVVWVENLIVLDQDQVGGSALKQGKPGQ
jgi:hypothetical protein